MRLIDLFRRSPPETTLESLRDLLECQNDRILTLEKSRRELEFLASRQQDDRGQLLEHTKPAKLQ